MFVQYFFRILNYPTKTMILIIGSIQNKQKVNQ